MPHDASELEDLFRDCFLGDFRTRLEGGAAEPLYAPSPDLESEPHRILYREDFFASALHEVAHWCLAGARRRQLEDYGYWYAADGRSHAEQSEFEKVEARPQAIEWILSDACHFTFHLSADNLETGLGASASFEAAVTRQKTTYLTEGLPPRAEQFRKALTRRVDWAAVDRRS